jgi:hypothetical protein
MNWQLPQAQVVIGTSSSDDVVVAAASHRAVSKTPSGAARYEMSRFVVNDLRGGGRNLNQCAEVPNRYRHLTSVEVSFAAQDLLRFDGRLLHPFGRDATVSGADRNVKAFITTDNYVVDLTGDKPALRYAGTVGGPLRPYADIGVIGDKREFLKRFGLVENPQMKTTRFAPEAQAAFSQTLDALPAASPASSTCLPFAASRRPQTSAALVKFCLEIGDVDGKTHERRFGGGQLQSLAHGCLPFNATLFWASS